MKFYIFNNDITSFYNFLDEYLVSIRKNRDYLIDNQIVITIRYINNDGISVFKSKRLLDITNVFDTDDFVLDAATDFYLNNEL